MADVAAAFELPCFAYLSLPPRSGSSKPQLISSYPVAWTSHYLASRYERVDPVIRQAASTPQPFEWGLGCGPERLSRQQKQLLDEAARSEEHTSELQSLMRISYAVFCLKNKTKQYTAHKHRITTLTQK